MQAPPHIVCLPIGREWNAAIRQRFDALLDEAEREFRLDCLEPAFDEPAVLDRVAQLKGIRPCLVLLAALHGGSARQLVLAATKSGIPTAIWCHDDSHSLASSALAMESLRQLLHPCVLLHADCCEELTSAVEAAAAVQRLCDARIGRLGTAHFNLISADVNPLLLLRRFGAWLVPLSLAGIQTRVEHVGQGAVEAVASALRERFTVDAAAAVLERAARLHIALQETANEQRLDAIAFDCWQEIVPGLKVSPCLGYASDDYVIACEGDLAAAVTLLAGEAICGGPGYLGDLYALDEGADTAVIMHCAGCAGLHSVAEPMHIVRQMPPGASGVIGDVVACHPVLPRGPGTLVLLHGEDLSRLHLRRCEIIGTEFSDQMLVHIRIDGDTAAFRRELAGNHYAVFPDDCSASWRQWAEWAGVTVG